MPVYAEGANTLSTNYTQFTSIFKARVIGQKSISLVIGNSHATAALNWKVLVSADPDGASTSYAEDKASASLTALTVAKQTITYPVAWVDVQISSTGVDSPQASVWMIAVEN